MNIGVSKIYMLLVISILVSRATSKSTTTATPKEGMYNIAILYPDGEVKTLDMDY